MINKKEVEVLSFIIKRQVGNDYIFLSPAEIIENMTEKADKEEIVKLLTDLSGRDAIKIKMLNLDECVLITTPKAKVLVEEFNDNEKSKQLTSFSEVVVDDNTTTEVEASKSKRFSFKKAEKQENKPQIVKAVVDYKKIFWAAFSGACCGGGIIAIIMLIISVA